jgi:hypothetical protein
MLRLEVTGPEILISYRPPDAGPNVGGYLGSVFPGGRFKGLGYDELLALGTGRREVLVDEAAPSTRGSEPLFFAEAGTTPIPDANLAVIRAWHRSTAG